MSQQLRDRLKKLTSLEERLLEDTKRLREEDRLLKLVVANEQILRKARQAETGSHMSGWLRSPGCGRRNHPVPVRADDPNPRWIERRPI
jgi:hypothetical protein